MAVATKCGMALPMHEKSGMANATPAIPLLLPLPGHILIPIHYDLNLLDTIFQFLQDVMAPLQHFSFLNNTETS